MHALNFEDICLRGDLAYRAMKNHVRLTEPDYRPDALEIMDGRDWPGDQRGRTLLALILQAQLTGWVSPYFQEILEDTLARVEAHGYMGAVMPQGTADEQQLSGHNWLLRGLLEVYTAQEDARVKAAADKLVRTLYLPCAPLYRSYPHDASLRHLDGKPSGVLIDEVIGGWKLSTDIGCAFMSMDSLTQYYQMFGGDEVGALIDEMIEAFFKLDPIGSRLQTHATLTAARGLMRQFETTGDAKLLAKAQEIHALYVQSGMTENYANFNWFTRPLWTEPCAIVDSYMLTMALFRATKKQDYLEYANRILYNAFYAAQRPNGGFGCDLCVQTDVRALSVREGCYEASWCCTMRGAEGLAQAARNAVLTDGQNALATFFAPGRYAAGALEFTVSGDYPHSGEMDIAFSSVASPARFAFYVPENIDIDRVRVTQDGKAIEMGRDGRILAAEIGACCALHVSLPLEIRELPARLSDGTTFWRGPLMLGEESDPKDIPADLKWAGEREYVYKGIRLFPVNTGIQRDKETVSRRQLKLSFDGAEKRA